MSKPDSNLHFMHGSSLGLRHAFVILICTFVISPPATAVTRAVARDGWAAGMDARCGREEDAACGRGHLQPGFCAECEGAVRVAEGVAVRSEDFQPLTDTDFH